MSAYGLQTHIWNNNLRSVLLLAGFPILLLALTYGLFLLFAGLVGAGDAQDAAAPFVWAAEQMAQSWPFALIGAGVWFAIAYLFNQQIIDAAVGAHEVTRKQEPELYNLLENLCISRGIRTPHLRVIETEAMNAFASGISEKAYSITVTRGIMRALNKDEMEAVLGHELTHIRNRDVRLMVIAVVFVGIFSFVGQTLFRMLMYGGVPRRSSSRDRGSGGAGLAVIIGLVLIAISYALAVVIRFALSRRREFLADAGSVELTKNPDAMISALRKISGHSTLAQAPAEVREMFIDNAHAGFSDLFATHPSIEARIAALKTYAGGRDAPPQAPSQAPQRRPGPWDNPESPRPAGPWG
ncbi:MAG TPA: M48 family metalloprotease [Caulobacterales bacterium]|nr:M48 family metalloprotease [Caulobacterales bacterium]